jgi:hypothetical protein
VTAVSLSRATAAGLLAVAALLAGGSACGSGADDPPAAPSYDVLVDLYSGRENPEVELSATVAEEIYGDLDGRAAEFQPATEPTGTLGFRGFVVTPSDPARPVLRVTPDSVFAVRDDSYRRLADPGHTYYRLILDDVKPRLSQDVRTALP